MPNLFEINRSPQNGLIWTYLPKRNHEKQGRDYTISRFQLFPSITHYQLQGFEMYHITDVQEEGNDALRRDIFPNIISGNTILFLGAGASITDDKKYLSRQLMDHHNAESGNSYQTDSIIEYVDVLSRNSQFDRKEFDDIVEKCLRNLEPTAFHTTIARLPWKEIITTNLDIIVEKAFDRVLTYI